MRRALPKRRWWATQGTLPFPVAEGLAKLDRQGSRVDGLDTLPAAFGISGVAYGIAQPGGLVVLIVVAAVVGVRRGRTAGRLEGREALVEEAQILGVVAVVGVGGVRDVYQLANQGMSGGGIGADPVGDSLGCLGTDALERVSLPSNLFGIRLGQAMGARLVDAAIVRLVRVSKEMRAVRTLQGRKICVSTWGMQRRDSSAMRVRAKGAAGSLTSASEGRRARPRHDEQMPMEWERATCGGLALAAAAPAAAARRETELKGR